MPPPLAAVFCISFVVYLFWVDRGKDADVSRAIWIPFCWMFLAGSRYVSHWLTGLHIYRSSASTLDVYAEGSPIDMAVFVCLMAASIAILMWRRVECGNILRRNYILGFFYLFGVLSICWSDYPFVALKRLIKSLGTLSMVLVVLTEERPLAAFGAIVKRLAFLLLPLSILFIKYYPELGRQYHVTGAQMFTGVTMQKNSLGQLCMIIGMYFCWKALYVRGDGVHLGRPSPSTVYVLVLAMVVWLQGMANSATALVCVLVGVCLLLLGRIPAVARRPGGIIGVCIGSVVLYAILQLAFDLNTVLIGLLNRRPDLTTRVPMWQDLLSMAANPYVGFGWQSFWLGERLERVYSEWRVLSTHNAYLDIYLNLGISGLLLFLGIVMAGLLKLRRLLALDYADAILKFSMIGAILLYGWSETIELGVSNTYALLLLSTMNVTELRQDATDGRIGRGRSAFASHRERRGRRSRVRRAVGSAGVSNAERRPDSVGTG